MKRILVAVVLMVVSTPGISVEIYNNDGNKIELYGKIKAQHKFMKDNNRDETYARLGFNGETSINSMLTGFGKFERQFTAWQAEGKQTETTRRAYAGIKIKNFGSIDYGRNYGIVYDIGSYADKLTEFGGDTFQRTDNFMTGRTAGVLTYRNNTLIDGVKFGLQFQGENKGRTWNKSNGQGFGYSIEYKVIDYLTIGGAYSRSRHEPEAKKYANGDASVWTVGVKYQPDNLYLAAMYAETTNQTPFFDKTKGKESGFFLDKTKNIEVMAAYIFDSGFRPSLGYIQSRANVQGYGVMDVVKYVQIGTSYEFNKNIFVDTGYKINLIEDNVKKYGISSDDNIVIAITYQF